MRSTTLAAAATLATAALVGTATADFVDVSIVSLGEVIPGTQTYQFFANFDNPADQLLSVSSLPGLAPLRFESDAALVQAEAVPGLGDTPTAGVTLPGDSWVTIGGDVANGLTDTFFTPGFLGGPTPGTPLIGGSSFIDAAGGGYFDFNPGTPANGGSVIIAQFTVGADATYLEYEGVVGYLDASTGGQAQQAFVAAIPGPAALAMLAAASLVSGRRRR